MGSIEEPIEQEIIRYLLGELSAEETDRFEEKYFTDDETFDRLFVVRTDLIDRYLHGRLSKEQTVKFENFFLQSPDHRREVVLMRSLLNPTEPALTGQRTVKFQQASWQEKLFGAGPAWVRVAAVAFGTLLLVGCFLLLIANRRMHVELNALREQQQTALTREKELREQLSTLQSRDTTKTHLPIPATSPTPNESSVPRIESPRIPVFLTLTPGLTRNAGIAERTDVPAETHNIKLRLLLDRDFGYHSYIVTLKSANDRTLQIRRGLRATMTSSGDAIEVEFSADTLDTGAYNATLSGIAAKGKPEEIADYAFRIIKK